MRSRNCVKTHKQYSRKRRGLTRGLTLDQTRRLFIDQISNTYLYSEVLRTNDASFCFIASTPCFNPANPFSFSFYIPFYILFAHPLTLHLLLSIFQFPIDFLYFYTFMPRNLLILPFQKLELNRDRCFHDSIETRDYSTALSRANPHQILVKLIAIRFEITMFIDALRQLFKGESCMM